MRLDFYPLDTDYVTLHVGVPFDHNSGPLKQALLQQEQGKHKTTKKQSYFFFNSEMKLKKKPSNKMIKENSLELVMRITSVQQFIICT